MYNLYYCWNESQKILLDEYFLPTLYQTQTKINPIGIEFQTKAVSKKFGSLEFRQLMLEKTTHIKNLTTSEKKPFIMSDIDIQFFEDIAPDLEEADVKNVDIVFQKEIKKLPADIKRIANVVNTGFMLIRPSQKLVNFWEMILHELVNYPKDLFINEQPLVNVNLDKINFDTFNNNIWCWSQGGLYWKCPNVNSISLHHANASENLEEKLAQFTFIRRQYRLYKPIKHIPTYLRKKDGSTLSGS